MGGQILVIILWLLLNYKLTAKADDFWNYLLPAGFVMMANFGLLFGFSYYF
jgi:hypothetical protein